MHTELVGNEAAPVLVVSLDAGEALITHGARLLALSGKLRPSATPRLPFWGAARSSALAARRREFCAEHASTLWLAPTLPGSILELCGYPQPLLIRRQACFAEPAELVLAEASGELASAFALLVDEAPLWLAASGCHRMVTTLGRLWVARDALLALDSALDVAPAGEAGFLISGAGRVWLEERPMSLMAATMERHRY